MSEDLEDSLQNLSGAKKINRIKRTQQPSEYGYYVPDVLPEVPVTSNYLLRRGGFLLSRISMFRFCQAARGRAPARSRARKFRERSATHYDSDTPDIRYSDIIFHFL